jgi:hypothetical protein
MREAKGHPASEAVAMATLLNAIGPAGEQERSSVVREHTSCAGKNRSMPAALASGTTGNTAFSSLRADRSARPLGAT